MSFFLLVLQSEKVRFLVAGAEISQSQKRKKSLESKVNREFKCQNLLKVRHCNPYFCLLSLFSVSLPFSLVAKKQLKHLGRACNLGARKIPCLLQLGE